MESAVVRQDSKETVATNRARTATTVRTVSKSASVRERPQLLVIEFPANASVIPASPESSVMLYVPNPLSVFVVPKNALRKVVQRVTNVTRRLDVATWIR